MLKQTLSVMFGSLSVVFLMASQVQALPILRETAGDISLNGMVTIYRDNMDANLYYAMPNSVGMVFSDQTKLPVFGLSTYGVEQSDITKAGGWLTFTMRPAMTKDIREMIDGFLKKTPGARLGMLPVAESYVTIGTDRTGKSSEGMKRFFESWDLPPYGGLFETEFGGNAVLTGMGAKMVTNAIKNPSLVALNACFTIVGVSPYMDADVTVDYQKVYSHWKAQASGGWSIFGGSVSHEVEKLKEEGAIDIRVHGDTKFEDVVMEMARQMAKDYLVPQLENTPAQVQDQPFRLIKFGWASVTREERHTITLKIRKQADVTDIRCIAAPLRDLGPYADKIIQNTPAN